MSIDRLVLLAAVIALIALPACSTHQPAPVEEQSDLVGKRRLNQDGSYSVREGDTLYAIAFHYGMDPQDIARWNGIASPYLIYPGQKLRMLAPPPGSIPEPAPSGVKTTGVKPAVRATTRPAQQAPKTAPAKKPVQQSPPPAKTSTTTKQSAAPKPSPAATGADPKSWLWPVKGRVLRGFVANNPSRNGLDIAGKEGQPVIATAPGDVVYSGSGLIGYGELIIIRHSENMLSAYAHNRVRLAAEGDFVAAGQKIAEMGRNAANEQILHFEIRVRGKPVNPLKFLPSK
ncbi:MAG: peptidoglycan DD-metalloendopeptidase family protein [Lysobacterales bacterium]